MGEVYDYNFPKTDDENKNVEYQLNINIPNFDDFSVPSTITTDLGVTSLRCESLKNGTHKLTFYGTNHTDIGELYLPKNYKELDRSYIYYPGAGGSANDAQVLREKYLNDSAMNEIVFIPVRNGTYNGDGTNATADDLMKNNLATEIMPMFLDKSSNNVQNVGFSNGGVSSLFSTIKTLEKNNDLSPRVITMLDAGDNIDRYRLNNDQIKLLVDNDATIVSFENYHESRPIRKQYLEELGAAGVNVIVIEDMTGNSKNIKRLDHMGVNREIINDNWISYLDGRDVNFQNINDYNYVFKKFNPQTGTYDEVKFDDVKMYLDQKLFSSNLQPEVETGTDQLLTSLSEYTFQTDNKVINDDLEVRNSIDDLAKSVNAFGNLGKLSFSSNGSTTPFPANVFNTLIKYFAPSIYLVVNFTEVMNNMSKISEQITKKDAELSSLADDFITRVDDVFTSSFKNVKKGVSDIIDKAPYIYEEVKDAIKTTSTSPNYMAKGVHLNRNNNSRTENIAVDEVEKQEDFNQKTISKEDDLKFNGVNNNEYKDNTNNSHVSNSSNEMNSNNNQVVYDNKDYLIVVKRDGEKVSGFEYCYKFDSNSTAKANFENITTAYIGNENVSKVVCDNNFVKVIFNDNLFKNSSFNDFTKRFNGLERI